MWFICMWLVLVGPTVHSMELNSTVLQEFRAVFNRAIDQHLQAEYYLLTPLMVRQNESWEGCKESVFERMTSCENCALSSCEAPLNEIFENWENIHSMLEAPGQLRPDWSVWREMGTQLFGSGLDTINGQPMVDKRLFGSFLFSSVLGGLTSLTSSNSFSGTLKTWGSSITNQVSSAVNSFTSSWKSFWGRRRRSIHPFAARNASPFKSRNYGGYAVSRRQITESRECVEECSECRPFLGKVREIVSEVCGNQMVLDETTMAEIIRELSELFRLNGDSESGTASILSKIEYNPNNFKLSSLSFGEVYVTAMTPSGPMTYLSEFRFRMQSVETSAIEMAEELIEKWGL